MTRYLALEWDQRELRLAAAQIRGSSLELDVVCRVQLSAGEVKPATGDIKATGSEGKTAATDGKTPLPEPKSGTGEFKPVTASGEFRPLGASGEFRPIGASGEFRPISGEGKSTKGEVRLPPDPLIAQKLAEAVDRLGLRRSQVLLVVGRSSIELKQLSLPPAPDDELPDLVRFQALRDFHSLGENWPLDFLPWEGSGTEPRSVLAAAIAPELVEQLTGTCQNAGLKAERLVLRPCAAVSLFLRSKQSHDQSVRLLVDLLNEEADLSVLVDRQPVFLRTARLPGNPLANRDEARPLVTEIRRTLVAAGQQRGGGKVEAVYLCGAGPAAEALAARLAQELSLPTHLFDPFSSVEVARKLKNELPENAGSFTPLVGLLCDAADTSGQMIDFLNPRRRVEPPSRRPRWMLAGVAAAALVLLVAVGGWRYLSYLDGRIAELTTQSQTLDPVVKASGDVQRHTNELVEWSRHDIVWLEELRRLAQKLPPAQQTMLTQLRGSLHPEGGQLLLEGRVNEAAVVDRLEQSLRDGRHAVSGQGRQQETSQPPYEWQFTSSVQVRVEEANRGAKPNAPVKPTAAPATPVAGTSPEKASPSKPK